MNMKKEKNEFDAKMNNLGFREASEDELPIAVRKHRQALKKKKKKKITISLDGDVIDYFKEVSGGKGYQTMINDALRNLISTKKEGIANKLLNDNDFINALNTKLSKLDESKSG